MKDRERCPALPRGMEHLPLVLAWREGVARLWGAKEPLDSLAPVSPRVSPRAWDGWKTVANVLLGELSLTREEAILHVSECLEACRAAGDRFPPPPPFFASQRSWEARLKAAEAREPLAKAPCVSPDAPATAAIRATAKMGEIAWKREKKLPVPESRRELWNEVLRPGKPLWIVLRAGGLSPHFVVRSRAVARETALGADLGEASRAFVRRKELLEEGARPTVAAALEKEFGDELVDGSRP